MYLLRLYVFHVFLVYNALQKLSSKVEDVEKILSANILDSEKRASKRMDNIDKTLKAHSAMLSANEQNV